MRKNNVIDFEDYSQYEPIDLESCFDPVFEPPDYLIEEWRRAREALNPFSEKIWRKIGNTWYEITTDCDGSERLSDKVKRLMFSEPLSRKEAVSW